LNKKVIYFKDGVFKQKWLKINFIYKTIKDFQTF
jgi:hypothetical protein